MIKIIDDFLPTPYADAIHYNCLYNLKYVYTQKTSTESDYGNDKLPIFMDENTVDSGQMVSVLYQPDSAPEQFYGELKPIVYTLQHIVPQLTIKGVIRVKANLLLKNSSLHPEQYNIPHQDAVTGCWTLLYYVNDSDGDTFLFNEHYKHGVTPEKLTICQRVTPKKNRAVLFNSSRYHASSNPRINQDRMVLNFVFGAEYAGY